MEIKEAVAFAVNADQILGCWSSASQMRQWLQERKNQRADKWTARLMDKAKKQKKEDMKKKEEEEAKAKEEAEKKKEEEEKKAEGDAEKKDEPEKKEEAEKKEDNQIDSSSKPADEKKAEDDKKEGENKEGDEKKEEDDEEKKYMLTNDEKAKVESDAFDKMLEDVQQIIKKIVDKAAFIIKLNIPMKFKKKDSTLLERGLTIIKAPSTFKDVENLPQPKTTKSDW